MGGFRIHDFGWTLWLLLLLLLLLRCCGGLRVLLTGLTVERVAVGGFRVHGLG